MNVRPQSADAGLLRLTHGVLLAGRCLQVTLNSCPPGFSQLVLDSLVSNPSKNSNNYDIIGARARCAASAQKACWHRMIKALCCRQHHRGQSRQRHDHQVQLRRHVSCLLLHGQAAIMQCQHAERCAAPDSTTPLMSPSWWASRWCATPHILAAGSLWISPASAELCLLQVPGGRQRVF